MDFLGYYPDRPRYLRHELKGLLSSPAPSLSRQAQAKLKSDGEFLARVHRNATAEYARYRAEVGRPVVQRSAEAAPRPHTRSAPLKPDGGLDITRMGPGEKLWEAVKRAPLADGLKEQVLGLVSPQTLGTMALVLGITLAANATPFGWLVSAGLLSWGLYQVGVGIFQVVGDFTQYAQIARNATSEKELQAAGRHFANAISVVGVQTAVAIIARFASKSVVKAKTQTKQALRETDPEPRPGLETRGYKPQPGERSTTREEYRAARRAERIENYNPAGRTSRQLSKDAQLRLKPTKPCRLALPQQKRSWLSGSPNYKK